jgi:hypothetical protein
MSDEEKGLLILRSLQDMQGLDVIYPDLQHNQALEETAKMSEKEAENNDEDK